MQEPDRSPRRAQLHDVLMEPPLRIQYRPGRNRVLVLSIAGAGKNNFDKPVLEFYKLAAGAEGNNHILFVIDDSRSWMNGPRVAERIVEAVSRTRDRIGAERVVALGNSMGGTMGLVLSTLMPLDAVIALTPQYSVDPAVVPEEKRWMNYRRRIRDFRFRTVDSLPVARTEFTILHGDTPDELAHALRFPVIPGLPHFILPGRDHQLARSLHHEGLLAPVIWHAIALRRRRTRQAVRAAGGMFRTDYESRLQRSA